MTVLGLILATFQQPAVSATVDRSRVEVGDDVVLTITAQASGAAIVDLLDEPAFLRLEILRNTQSTVFSAGGEEGRRTTTWQFDLRAALPGTATLGPFRIRVDDEEFLTPTVSVEIAPVSESDSTTLDERIAAIVDRAPGPDGSDEVVVSVVPSSDTLVLGEQLDLVVVAWFPRDVRTRLRTRPTLTPPELQGGWAYSQNAALGVAATRDVADRSYDLFVHHQVVFPLTPGAFTVGPATVSYNLPLRMSILSREVPQEVQSAEFAVTVLPQPSAGRPDGFGGTAASDLRLEMAMDTAGFAGGRAATITATVSGRGNVALWPEPELQWPDGLRVYPGNAEIHVDTEAGYVRGSKSFTYLLVADSVGAFNLPSIEFTYFDLDARTYRSVQTSPIQLVARVGREAVPTGADPPSLITPVGPTVTGGFVAGLRWFHWTILFVVPPLLLGFRLTISAVARRKRRSAAKPPTRNTLVELNDAFRAALRQLVPEGHLRDGDGLATALRAAGVEPPVAAHATRVRDRLQQAIYGPEGVTDAEELAAEVQEVLRALPGGRVRGYRMGTAAAIATLVVATGATAQAPTAEQLFEAGFFDAAADSFVQRASAEQSEAAHWFNAGAAWWGANSPTRARAAWITAARLRPRDATIRAALSRAGGLDPITRRMVPVFPLTPAEAAAVAAALWIIAWGVLALGVRLRRAWPVLALSVLAAAFSAYGHTRYGESTALIVTPDTPLREAPFMSAPVRRTLPDNAAVTITRKRGAWRLVRRGDARGWVLDAELARI